MQTRAPRRGATMVEYAVMLMLISITCMLVISALGTRVARTYDTVNQPITTVTAGPTPPSIDVGAGHGGGAGPVNTGGTTAAKGNNGRGGNPGQGNNGNDKGVGNAPPNSGKNR